MQTVWEQYQSSIVRLSSCFLNAVQMLVSKAGSSHQRTSQSAAFVRSWHSRCPVDPHPAREIDPRSFHPAHLFRLSRLTRRSCAISRRSIHSWSSGIGRNFAGTMWWTLSEPDQIEYMAWEEVIASGWATFVQVGVTLATIRDNDWYKLTRSMTTAGNV